MAKRRRSQSKKNRLPKAAEVVGFSEADEAFFRAGDELAAAAELAPGAESVAVADPIVHRDGAQRPSFWRRLFARRSQLRRSFVRAETSS